MTGLFETVSRVGPGPLLVIVVALLASGVIKGATGAGAPIFAIPTMAFIVDVRFAILTMLIPNLLTNIWQAIFFRRHQPDRRFVLPYVLAGGIGVAFGTALLVNLSAEMLALLVSFSALIYVGFRLAKPDWRLSFEFGRRLAVPAGLGAGLLQGATGLAAPILLTFLSALRLERLAFIATVSLMFVTFSLVHIGSLAVAGLLTPSALLISALALAPVAAGMTIGSKLAAGLEPKMFDWIILLLLAIIAGANLLIALGLV